MINRRNVDKIFIHASRFLTLTSFVSILPCQQGVQLPINKQHININKTQREHLITIAWIHQFLSHLHLEIICTSF